MIVDDDPEAVGRAIGGHARAAALTKEERREIAQRAAAAPKKRPTKREASAR